MVLYALHRLNFPLKVEIVTISLNFTDDLCIFKSVFNLSLLKYSFDKLLQANALTYRVQTLLIKCTLNGYIRCNMTAEFQRGLGWSRPLLSLMSKYCLMILLITLTYVTLSDL